MKKTAKKISKSAKKSAPRKPAQTVTARKSAAKKTVARKPVGKAPAATKLPRKKPPLGVTAFPASLALYVYGITQVPDKPIDLTAEAVDGRGVVEPIAEGNYLCWTSRVSRQEFAIDLQKHMEDLEWLAACSIRHQKVLSEIGAITQVLPARFGTIFLTPDTLIADLREKSPHLREVFKRISDADEWGVKVFGAARQVTSAATTAASGSDYLRQKSAALQGSASARRDEALQRFGDELADASEATVPGGKASASQPGLLWSGSFLVKRTHKKQFETVLRRYATEWADSRRIDVSGPWPPYSFVNESQ